ncbi:MOSC domain-containing protein [Agromyces silvae]|uniref:MOSC domain-containing protein n=1 Tax=Agromyces silvae TaxID=3388266 RepID=UPI00280AAE62|nr:MOSC domain-containing protein [Agromyces protaetiae]
MSVDEGQPVGRVSELLVTATKGFALHSVPSIEVDRTRIVGNREFFLVDVDDYLYSVPRDPVFLSWWTAFDRSAGTFSIGHGTRVVASAPIEHPDPVGVFRLDDRTVQAWPCPGPWDAILSTLAGRDLRLVQCAGTEGGHDVYPVTVVSTASLAALGTERDGTPVDPRRFRLNLTLDLGGTPFIEDAWEGREIAVGTCRLRVRESVPRCLAVEHRPADGDRALQMQKRIREVRGATPSRWGPNVPFGCYAEVLQPGIVQLDDPVLLVPPPADPVDIEHGEAPR